MTKMECAACGHSADDHMITRENDYCVACDCENFSTSTLAIKNLGMINDPYPGSLEWVRDQIGEAVKNWFLDIQNMKYEVNAPSEKDYKRIATETLLWLRSVGYEPQKNDPKWEEWEKYPLGGE